MLGEGGGKGLALFHAAVEVNQDFFKLGMGLLLGEGFKAGAEVAAGGEHHRELVRDDQEHFRGDGLAGEGAFKAGCPGEAAFGHRAGAHLRLARVAGADDGHGFRHCGGSAHTHPLSVSSGGRFMRSL